MKTALFILLGLVALFALAALVLQLAGSRLPREHRSQLSVTLRASRTAVWAAVTDYAKMPAWWPAVKSIRTEKLADGTELTWNTDKHGQEIAFRTQEERPRERLVRVIAGPKDLPFGGTWTYELADTGEGGTRLTLTENGTIEPPVYRALATWVFGLDTTQKDFLTQLEKHLAAKSK
jgi:uncharacterized protein YndB with AHSA1/START domain